MPLGRVLLLLLLAMPGVASTSYQATVLYPQLPSEVWPQLFAADTAGNLFIVSYEQGSASVLRILIVKTDPRGKTLARLDLNTAGAGSNGLGTEVTAAACDPGNNLVLVGSTSSRFFPQVSPVASSPRNGGAFVMTIDSQLQKILFSTKLGGTRDGTAATALAFDRSGNIYVTGGTTDPDFPVTPGAFQKRPPRGDPTEMTQYAFLTEINPATHSIVFSTFYGDAANACDDTANGCATRETWTVALAIALDGAGNIVIGGETTESGLHTTPGVIGPDCGACEFNHLFVPAGFLAAFSPDGSQLRWATYVPLASARNNGTVSIDHLAFDAAGNLVASGFTSAGLPVTAGALQEIFPGAAHTIDFAGFVMKLEPSAQHLLFSTYFGLEDAYRAYGIVGLAITPQGSIWLTGTSVANRLPVPRGTPLLGGDYLAELSADGKTLEHLFAAPPGAAGVGIALSADGSVTILGTDGALLTARSGEGPSLVAVGNSAGLSTASAIAPYELVTLYGMGLGPATPVEAQAVSGVIPASLAGVQVLFDGKPAPILSASSTQIKVVVPGSTAARDSTTLRIVTPSGILNGPAIPVKSSQPGVFTEQGANSVTLAAIATAWNEDGSVNSAGNPAALGSVVTVLASGAGMSSAPQPDGTILNQAQGGPTLPMSVFTSQLIGLIRIGQRPDAPRTLEVLSAEDAVGMVAGVAKIRFRLQSVEDDCSFNNVGFWLRAGDALSDGFGIYLKAR